MSLPGARPCKSHKCDGILILLPNRKTGSWVPVDISSLSEDDQDRIAFERRASAVDFDPSRHVMHHRTCKDVDRFASPQRKKSPEAKMQKRKSEQASLFKPPARNPIGD